jgi:hypothetical protein
VFLGGGIPLLSPPAMQAKLTLLLLHLLEQLLIRRIIQLHAHEKTSDLLAAVVARASVMWLGPLIRR